MKKRGQAIVIVGRYPHRVEVATTCCAMLAMAVTGFGCGELKSLRRDFSELNE